MANWFQRLFKRASVSVGYTGAPGFTSHMRHYGTMAGANINIDQALSISVVYACVQRVASTIAQLNKTVMANTALGTLNVDSPVDKLINYAPNDMQTAYDFWETYVADILLYGKAYAVIMRDPRTAAPLRCTACRPTKSR